MFAPEPSPASTLFHTWTAVPQGTPVFARLKDSDAGWALATLVSAPFYTDRGRAVAQVRVLAHDVPASALGTPGAPAIVLLKNLALVQPHTDSPREAAVKETLPAHVHHAVEELIRVGSGALTLYVERVLAAVASRMDERVADLHERLVAVEVDALVRQMPEPSKPARTPPAPEAKAAPRPARVRPPRPSRAKKKASA